MSELWSINALSSELGIDRRTLSNRLADLPPASIRELKNRTERKWKLADVQAHLATFTAAKELAQAEKGTLEYEKLRLTRAQADNMELKNELARGDVAPIELIERVLRASSAEVAGILDSLPLTIKRKHPELSTQIIESIKRQVVKSMNVIANSTACLDVVLDEYIRSLEV